MEPLLPTPGSTVALRPSAPNRRVRPLFVSNQVRKEEWGRIAAQPHLTPLELSSMTRAHRNATLFEIVGNNIAYVYARHPDPWMQVGSLCDRYLLLLGDELPYGDLGVPNVFQALQMLRAAGKVAYEQVGRAQHLVRPLPLGEDDDVTAEDFVRAKAAVRQLHVPVGRQPRFTHQVDDVAALVPTLQKAPPYKRRTALRPDYDEPPPAKRAFVTSATAEERRVQSGPQTVLGADIVLPPLKQTSRTVAQLQHRVRFRHLQRGGGHELSRAVHALGVRAKRNEVGALDSYWGPPRLPYRPDKFELERINRYDAEQVRQVVRYYVEAQEAIGVRARSWTAYAELEPPTVRSLVAPQIADAGQINFGVIFTAQRSLAEIYAANLEAEWRAQAARDAATWRVVQPCAVPSASSASIARAPEQGESAPQPKSPRPKRIDTTKEDVLILGSAPPRDEPGSRAEMEDDDVVWLSTEPGLVMDEPEYDAEAGRWVVKAEAGVTEEELGASVGSAKVGGESNHPEVGSAEAAARFNAPHNSPTAERRAPLDGCAGGGPDAEVDAPAQAPLQSTGDAAATDAAPRVESPEPEFEEYVEYEEIIWTGTVLAPTPTEPSACGVLVKREPEDAAGLEVPAPAEEIVPRSVPVSIAPTGIVAARDAPRSLPAAESDEPSTSHAPELEVTGVSGNVDLKDEPFIFAEPPVFLPVPQSRDVHDGELQALLRAFCAGPAAGSTVLQEAALSIAEFASTWRQPIGRHLLEAGRSFDRVSGAEIVVAETEVWYDAAAHSVVISRSAQTDVTGPVSCSAPSSLCIATPNDNEHPTC